MRRIIPLFAILFLAAAGHAQGVDDAAEALEGGAPPVMAEGAAETAAEGAAEAPEEASPEPAGSLDRRPSDLIARFGVQVVLNMDQSVPIVSGPSPVVVVPGLAMVLPLAERLSLSPGLEFYSAYYDWANDRAVPIGVEGRSAAVWALIADIPLAYDIKLPRAKNPSALGAGASSAQQRLILQGGIAILARAPFLAEGLLPAEQEAARATLEPIGNYMWEKGRFLYPSFGLGYSYELADWVSFGVSARVMIPIFNLWTGEDIPFADSLHAGGGIWVSFTDFWRRLKAPKRG